MVVVINNKIPRNDEEWANEEHEQASAGVKKNRSWNASATVLAVFLLAAGAMVLSCLPSQRNHVSLTEQQKAQIVRKLADPKPQKPGLFAPGGGLIPSDPEEDEEEEDEEAPVLAGEATENPEPLDEEPEEEEISTFSPTFSPAEEEEDDEPADTDTVGGDEPEDADTGDEEEPTDEPADIDTTGEEEPAPQGPVNPDATYFADYQARFKRVVSEGCEAPTEDTVALICAPGEMEILSVPDDVFCTPPDDLSTTEGQISFCQTQCQGVACDDSYIDRNFLSVLGDWYVDDDIYSEIEFRCSGDGDVNGVDAEFLVVGSETTGNEGSCSGDENGNGANFVLAELNVKCPTEEGGFDYVNEDGYVECLAIPLPFINDRYTCFSGDLCQTSACAVTYEDVHLLADHHRYQECIQSDDGSGIPEPDEPEGDEEKLEGQYVARFQVGSGYWYDDDNCVGQKAGLKIECIDGDIALVNNPDNNCEVTDSSTVECQELPTSVVNEHVDVLEYECTSYNQIPPTRAEYLPTSVSCESRNAEVISRFINIGVLCGDPGDETYASLDYFFECATENKYWDTTDDIRFSCEAEVTVPEDSTGEEVEVGAAIVFTDYRWQHFSSDRCYSFKAGLTADVGRSPENPDGPGV